MTDPRDQIRKVMEQATASVTKMCTASADRCEKQMQAQKMVTKAATAGLADASRPSASAARNSRHCEDPKTSCPGLGGAHGVRRGPRGGRCAAGLARGVRRAAAAAVSVGGKRYFVTLYKKNRTMPSVADSIRNIEENLGTRLVHLRRHHNVQSALTAGAAKGGGTIPDRLLRLLPFRSSSKDQHAQELANVTKQLESYASATTNLLDVLKANTSESVDNAVEYSKGAKKASNSDLNASLAKEAEMFDALSMLLDDQQQTTVDAAKYDATWKQIY